MKQALFTGVGTAIVTPFKNGAVNFPAFGRLIDRQLAGGIHAIIVCGTTGEAATMTQKERLETIQYASTVLQAASRHCGCRGQFHRSRP